MDFSSFGGKGGFPLEIDLPLMIFDGYGQPRESVDERSRRSDAQHPEQEFILLRRMDSQQCSDGSLLDPASWSQDVIDLCGQLDLDPGALQACG